MNNWLFRAKQRGTQEWVYGYPLRDVDCCHSVWRMHIPAANPDENNRTVYIDEATLGSWTGLEDASGKRIFEGDIVKGIAYSMEMRGVIVWIEKVAGFGVLYCNRADPTVWEDSPIPTVWENSPILKRLMYERIGRFAAEVVGNRWDNPELLEEQEEEIELHPCPFCGDEPYFVQTKTGRWYVRCYNKNCVIFTGSRVYSTRAEAAKAWNQRTKK